MKVVVEKYIAEQIGVIQVSDINGIDNGVFPVIEGYKYYIFRTADKAWVKHSKKLTKQEKQWVIEHESK